MAALRTTGALIISALLSGTALAQPLALQGDQPVAAAPALAAEGRDEDALKLIAALPPAQRAQPDVALMEAQLLRRTGQPKLAVDIYRRLLSRSPDDQRVRLELAQTLFEMNDLRASQYYFRLALSGDLPDADRQLARAYLQQAMQLRPWTVTGGLGVAPDSNVNGATSAREVEIGGLPLELSQAARRRSGVTLNGYLNAEGSLRLAEEARLVGGAWVQVSENRSRDVSSEGIGLRLGPEFSRPDRRWSLLGLAERRWYGGQPYYTAEGLSLNGDLATDQGVTVYSAAALAQRLDYDVYNGRDGWLYGLDLQRTHYLSPQTFWRASASLRANRAARAAESYDSARLAVGAYRSLPWRLGVYVEPAIMVSRYRGRSDLFGVVREDRGIALSGRLVKEDYTLWGFAPYLGAEVSRTDSNISFYAYDRGRGEIGLTRTF